MKLPAFIFRYRLHHMIVWLIVGAVWYYFRIDDFSTNSRLLLITVIKTAHLAILFYITSYLLIPKLLYREKYLAFILIYLAMVFLSSLYIMHVSGIVSPNAALREWWTNVKGRIYDNVLPHFFLVTAGVSIKLVVDYIRVQNRLAILAKEKAEAELNFLKSQINPHFLFNSINAVYFLIDKENAEARRALHTFSEMLRYQLYEIGDEKIPIEKEVGFLRDYIGLQSLRNDRCEVKMEVTPGVQSFFIEPLLLIPFVENSFKHLSHFSERSNEIQIGLSESRGALNFHIRNTTEGQVRNGVPGGIGLDNVRRRLELLYPKRHKLKVVRQEEWFDVQLHIQIDK